MCQIDGQFINHAWSQTDRENGTTRAPIEHVGELGRQFTS